MDHHSRPPETAIRRLLMVALGLGVRLGCFVLGVALILAVVVFIHIWREGIIYSPRRLLLHRAPSCTFTEFSVHPTSGEIVAIGPHACRGIIRVNEKGDYEIETKAFDGSTEVNPRTIPRTICESPRRLGGVCHSNDGRVVALVAEHEGEGRLAIVLRDSQNLALTHGWKAHHKEIDSLVYDTSGSHLASRCHHLLKIWNARDQQLVTSAVIPDGLRDLTDLARFEDGFAGVYQDVSTGEPGVYQVTPPDPEFVRVSTLQDIGKPIRSAAISREGKTIAAVCYDESEQAELWIYDGPTGNPRFRLHGGDMARPRELVIAPSGGRLAAFFSDDSISVWDLRTKRTIVTLSNFCGSVVGMFFPDDGTLLVSDWRNLTVWDLTRREVDD